MFAWKDYVLYSERPLALNRLILGDVDKAPRRGVFLYKKTIGYADSSINRLLVVPCVFSKARGGFTPLPFYYINQ